MQRTVNCDQSRQRSPSYPVCPGALQLKVLVVSDHTEWEEAEGAQGAWGYCHVFALTKMQKRHWARTNKASNATIHHCISKMCLHRVSHLQETYRCFLMTDHTVAWSRAITVMTAIFHHCYFLVTDSSMLLSENRRGKEHSAAVISPGEGGKYTSPRLCLFLQSEGVIVAWVGIPIFALV